MAVIYDKAPKRKDFSGVVNKEEKENKDKTTTEDSENVCIHAYLDLCFCV